MAAERLGVRPEDCLVFEDAPAGILAGIAAGADVVVVTGAHEAAEGTPHLTLARYHDIEVELASDGMLSLRQAL